MKKVYLIILFGIITCKIYAQDKIGKFYINASSGDKVLDVEELPRVGISKPTYKLVLKKKCSSCASQIWEVFGSQIKNAATGKYLVEPGIDNKILLLSTRSRYGWAVFNAIDGKVGIGVYNGRRLSSTPALRKLGGDVLYSFPCETPLTNCEDVLWKLEEVEAYATIPKYDFGTLCPTTILSGDREFDGNGPRITGNVALSFRNNNKEVWATVLFDAKELKSDWSHTRQTWEKMIYTAPSGKRITDFHSTQQPITSSFDFVSGKSTSEIERIAKQQLVYTNFPMRGTNQEPLIITGNVVYKMEIVGDTAGDDISNDTNCNDDTRINNLLLSSFTVRLQNL
ncbi:MAG: hypothetical protein EOO07_30340 [Chitinophagaceae bacterium]|nr:MAG: hypothetical protein EOO07_30340 [Chitinophagaceae bacterium]